MRKPTYVLVNDSGSLPHGCVKDDIDKVGRCGHRRDALKTCDGRHDDSCWVERPALNERVEEC